MINQEENIENAVLKEIEEHNLLLKLEGKKHRNDQKKREEEDLLHQQKEKALKSMKYLLNISETYSNLIKEKLVENNKAKGKAKGPKKKKVKPLAERKLYELTAEELENATDEMEEAVSKTICLSYFTGGILHPYQEEGVQWLVTLFMNGLNGMLADEMGLGKTIQVIALISHLLEIDITGPYLIVCPLSTVPNWLSEFERFAPKIPVIKFHGSKEERLEQQKYIEKIYTVGDLQTKPVVITSYSMPLIEFKFLNRFHWQYIIIDEGHRIKDHECRLSTNLRTFMSRNRLLLTGTPLQNNITELWALLNFLVPHIFKDMDTFAALFVLDEIQDKNSLLEQEEKNNLISTIHRVLAPFMLRRLKKDVLPDMVPKKEVTVYCPLSTLQRDLYQFVLQRDIQKLRGEPEEEIDFSQPRKRRKCTDVKPGYYKEFSDTENIEKLTNFEMEYVKKKKEITPFIIYLTMSNTMMMYKKIVSHPYLVHFPLDPSKPKKQLLINEDLVQSSGKLMVLDAMLPKLKQQGHKVLLFSTLVMCLDLIEEYLIMRKYNYRKLDGSYSLAERAAGISDFNNDPKILIYLISTRAGGLGLNLTAADTVIFFDRDWNPQVDIQAQDRCHRLGQTKPVMVYTLVTKNTIDEKVIARGHVKRRLEKVVIKDGKFKTLNNEDRNKLHNELLELQTLLNSEPLGHKYIYKELDKLLDRSDLYKQMNSI